MRSRMSACLEVWATAKLRWPAPALLPLALLCACSAPPPAASPPKDQVAAHEQISWDHDASDVHMHFDRHEAGQDAKAVTRVLREAGFAFGCVLSPGYHEAKGCSAPPCEGQLEWTRSSNDWTIDQARSSPRLRPFCAVPLNYEWSASEVKRCVQAGGRGVSSTPEGTTSR